MKGFYFRVPEEVKMSVVPAASWLEADEPAQQERKEGEEGVIVIDQ